jgi:hypothetical protein
VTSSISILQPSISFFEDELGLRRRGSLAITAAVSLVMGAVAMLGVGAGAIDEMDFWGGTFLLVFFGAVEAIVFAWIFGADRGWKELMDGAHIAVPRFFRFIIKYVTPVYLLAILGFWLYADWGKVILLRGIDPNARVEFADIELPKTTFIWLLRGALAAILAGFNAIIYVAWRRRKLDAKLIATDSQEASHA